MASNNPKYMFPRFYVKSVGGFFSLYHRLSHSLIGMWETEGEMVAEIKKWNKLKGEEFWRELLALNLVKMPKQNSPLDNYQEHQEEWFITAWSFYTDKFYDQHKKLLVIEEEIPYEIVNKIRAEKAREELIISKKLEEEKREAERVYQMSLKELRQEQRSKGKEETGVIGKIGSMMSMDKLKKQLPKKKKLSIKTKSAKVIDIVDTEDLFA